MLIFFALSISFGICCSLQRHLHTRSFDDFKNVHGRLLKLIKRERDFSLVSRKACICLIEFLKSGLLAKISAVTQGCNTGIYLPDFNFL